MPSLFDGPPEGRPYHSEEDAKIRWIVPLLEELGHDRNRDISFEVPISWQAGTTTQTGRADLVVYVGEIPVIVGETKAPGQPIEAAREQAITYAKSYSPIVPFVLAHDRTSVLMYRASGEPGRQGDYVIVHELPTRGELLGLLGLAEEHTVLPDSEKAEAISRVVASEHYRHLLSEAVRLVLNQSTLEGVAAVSDLSKVLVTKMYHELSGTGRFRPGANIQAVFDEAKTAYPGLYRQGESIAMGRATFDAVARLLAQTQVAP